MHKLIFMKSRPLQVLFICTGNYYRSRFAEAFFNHMSLMRGSPWRAVSRGLAIHLAEGDISPIAMNELKRRNISPDNTAPTRIALTLTDLQTARRAIALHEPEHKPMIQLFFPNWSNRIQYWKIGDIGEAEPEDALNAIVRHVSDLHTELENSGSSFLRKFFKKHKKHQKHQGHRNSCSSG